MKTPVNTHVFKWWIVIYYLMPRPIIIIMLFSIEKLYISLSKRSERQNKGRRVKGLWSPRRWKRLRAFLIKAQHPIKFIEKKKVPNQITQEEKRIVDLVYEMWWARVSWFGRWWSDVLLGPRDHGHLCVGLRLTVIHG